MAVTDQPIYQSDQTEIDPSSRPTSDGAVDTVTAAEQGPSYPNDVADFVNGAITRGVDIINARNMTRLLYREYLPQNEFIKLKRALNSEARIRHMGKGRYKVVDATLVEITDPETKDGSGYQEPTMPLPASIKDLVEPTTQHGSLNSMISAWKKQAPGQKRIYPGHHNNY